MIWGCQLRATPARVNILKALSDAPKPLSINDILKKLKKSRAANDFATVYRTVEKFAESGLVDRISLGVGGGVGGGKSLYEMSLGRKHHHHAVCTSCGAIEDVTACKPKELNDLARRGLKKFRHIQSHSLEFFGLCRKCEKKH